MPGTEKPLSDIIPFFFSSKPILVDSENGAAHHFLEELLHAMHLNKKYKRRKYDHKHKSYLPGRTLSKYIANSMYKTESKTSIM